MRTRRNRAVMRNDSTGQVGGSVGRWSRSRNLVAETLVSMLAVDNRQWSDQTREELERLFAEEVRQRKGAGR